MDNNEVMQFYDEDLKEYNVKVPDMRNEKCIACKTSEYWHLKDTYWVGNLKAFRFVCQNKWTDGSLTYTCGEEFTVHVD